VSLHSIRAGLVYFLLVFVAGFLLGTMRTFVVAPAIGDVPAVLVEVPLMLAVAWLACGWVTSKASFEAKPAELVAMGATALLLLLAAEASVSVWLGNMSLNEHFRSYRRADVLIGLAAQGAYGCFPLVRGLRPRDWHQ
jgi:hypothetical protein